MFLVRKENKSGEILNRFTAKDSESAMRKVYEWAGMKVKFDGGNIFRYTDEMDGELYTILDITDSVLLNKKTPLTN